MSRVLLYFLRREGSLGGGGVLHPRLDSPPGHKSRQMRTLQHTATHSRTSIESLVFTCAHCNTPQHTATHCNTLTQHTATHSRTSLQSLVFTIVADEREYVLYGNIDLSVSVPHSPPFAQLLNAESHFVGCVFSCLCVHV